MPETGDVWFTEAEPTPGKSTPIFIIKVGRPDGDHYYLTKVVWEYPPSATLPSDYPDRPERVVAITEVVNLYNTTAGPGVDAKEIPEDVSGISNGQAGGR